MIWIKFFTGKSFFCTFVLFEGILSAYANLPPRCSGSINVTCFPVIPSFPQVYGWNLSNAEVFKFLKINSDRWTLKTLPSGMFNLATNIKQLYMDDIGLEYLQCDIFQPMQHSIEMISMDDNMIDEFPSCAFRNLPSVKVINMRQLGMTSCEMVNLNMKSINEINLSQNILKTFNLFNLNSASDLKIVLDNNVLTHINLSKNDRLWYLSAKKNRFVRVERALFAGSQDSLKYLDMSDNYIKDQIWDSLLGISNLTDLILRNNHIQTASASVLNCAKSLRNVDLSFNRISTIEGVKLRSGQMTNVLLAANKITNIPSYLLSKRNTFASPWHGVIDFSSNLISQITLTIPVCNGSCKVRLDGNVLTDLKFDNDESQLCLLNISHNLLTSLPETMPEAMEYYLSDNPLSTENVIDNLVKKMSSSSIIFLDGVYLFCGYKSERLPVLKFKYLQTLSMKNNCIPIWFVCFLESERTDLNLYLDGNNNLENSTCRINEKSIETLSIKNSSTFENILNVIVSKESSEIENITQLYLNGYEIQTLPPVKLILSKSRMYAFEFKNNGFQSIDNFTVLAKAFKRFSLDFEGNRIKNISKLKIEALQCLKESVITISLRKNLITHLNESLLYLNLPWRFRECEIYLDISNNQITYLDVSKLIFVNNSHGYHYYRYNRFHWIINVHVNASDNKINRIPIINSCLPYMKLASLDLSNNKLRTLPNDRCIMARDMFFGHNLISSLNKLATVDVVNMLDLQWNLIENIPDDFFDNAYSLKNLNLQGNRLQKIPAALYSLRRLTSLDISYNNIHVMGQSDIAGKFENLETLILTGNNFVTFPEYKPLVRRRNPLIFEGNKVHCDCKMLFLRNYTLQSKGRCSSPPEVEGYQVACFPERNCITTGPLYKTRETIQKCRNDKFVNLRISFTETKGSVTVFWVRLGGRQQTYVRCQGFQYRKLLTTKTVNQTSQSSQFVLDFTDELTRVCITLFYDLDDKFEWCINFHSSITEEKKTVYALSSVFAVSLCVNIAAIYFILKMKVRRKKRLETQSGNDQSAYEIPLSTEGTNCASSEYDAFNYYSN